MSDYSNIYEDFWETLLMSSAQRRPTLAAFLQAGRVLRCDDQQLVIGFALENSFSRDSLLNPDYFSELNQAVENVCGRPLEIEIITIDKPVSPSYPPISESIKKIDTAIHNQAIGTDNPIVWKNLRFRSQSEVRIAQALDREPYVMFFPNCKTRLGNIERRENREPDFLVCYRGKWGILEVDGEPSHPPSRIVEDHERDRLFKYHGVLVVEHFDAAECFENPKGVVEKFLHILGHAR